HVFLPLLGGANIRAQSSSPWEAITVAPLVECPWGPGESFILRGPGSPAWPAFPGESGAPEPTAVIPRPALSVRLASRRSVLPGEGGVFIHRQQDSEGRVLLAIGSPRG